MKPGENARRSPKVGELVKDPRNYFAKLFGVGKTYVEHARELLEHDPLAAAAVKDGSAASLKDKYEALQRRIGGVANDRILPADIECSRSRWRPSTETKLRNSSPEIC